MKFITVAGHINVFDLRTLFTPTVKAFYLASKNDTV